MSTGGIVRLDMGMSKTMIAVCFILPQKQANKDHDHPTLIIVSENKEAAPLETQWLQEMKKKLSGCIQVCLY